MTKTLFFFILCSLICTYSEAKNDFKSKRVVISGKILNYDPANLAVELAVNQVGFGQKMIYSKLDSLGRFTASFESYIPTDVCINYRMNFLVLTHPGDSLYMEFDGSREERTDILKTIRFSGDAARCNQAASAFQLVYYSNELYRDWNKKEKARREYDLPSFTLYLDTLQRKSYDLIDKFVYENAPPEETRIWAQVFIDQDYYDQLCFYTYQNQLSDKKTRYGIDWSEHLDYLELLKNRLPITPTMLISGYAISNYINQFQYNYLLIKTVNDYYRKVPDKSLSSEMNSTTPYHPITDSLLIRGIINNATDTLAAQLVLTAHLGQLLDSYRMDLFENNLSVIKDYIHQPFLKIPLLEFYAQTKERIAHPDIASDLFYKKLEAAGAGQIMDSILTANKGKVIFIDCWATWCHPCRSEMPASKRLMKDLDGKDVAFVFLCLDSEEKNWKASLDEFKIGGQHLFLTREQSTALRESLEVDGVPYHILIDRSGTIIEKGNHLRPDNAKPDIERLLNPSSL